MKFHVPTRFLAQLVGISIFCPSTLLATPPFAIDVVDAATSRGVPMVHLRTTAEVSFWTDSAGAVAFDEPGLMDQPVYFFIEADGYEYPADGFGYRGVALTPEHGGQATIEIHRTQIAERVYRITGAGIYRDTVLLGREAPLANPLLAGKVVGQDSVQSIVYQGRIHWFWGDTGRPAYPLGNFATAGATSPLPSDGSLPAAVGINLEYYTDKDGFARAMVEDSRPGVKWIDGLMLLTDPEGNERLLAKSARMKSLGEKLGSSIIQWDDEHESFLPLKELKLQPLLEPAGKPILINRDGQEWYYFPTPFPTMRVKADWDSVLDPESYEAFTCLALGSRWAEGEEPDIERDSEGAPVWGWKRNTRRMEPQNEAEFVKRGLLTEAERRLSPKDIATSETIQLHNGTVAWNEYRNRWIMIANQIGGDPSFLGEVWYLEANQPEGPWNLARKIASHAKHTFYNPVHHPFLDEEGGRIVYFEGTYADTFSGGAAPTPRYNYNQIMYRLDLNRAALPQ